MAHSSKLSWGSQLCTRVPGCLQPNCTPALPCSLGVPLLDRVGIRARSAKEAFQAKSLTDAKWCGGVRCIPQPKAAGIRLAVLCTRFREWRGWGWGWGCAGWLWCLTALTAPETFGEAVFIFIFYLNPRTEQNTRSSEEGDNKS